MVTIRKTGKTSKKNKDHVLGKSGYQRVPGFRRGGGREVFVGQMGYARTEGRSGSGEKARSPERQQKGSTIKQTEKGKKRGKER